MGMQRRTLLGALITAAALGNTVALTSTARADTADGYAALRAKWVTVLTGGSALDTAPTDKGRAT